MDTAGSIAAGAGNGAASASVTGARGTAEPAAMAEPATMADVVACYRLLLGRQPDSAGLRHYRERLRQSGLSVGQVVQEFLGSVEFSRGQGLTLARRRRSGEAPSEVVRTVEGFSLNVDPADFAVGHTIARTGSYEPEVSAVLRQVLRPGQTFVDIGANLGWFSLLGASVVGPKGQVVAIEPNPLNVALLRKSAAENGFGNISAICVALGEAPGAAALETDGSNGRVVPVAGPPEGPIEASFVVACWPLDKVLASAGLERVDVIKLDVEGAEPLVLRGGVATITRDRPSIITEFYPLALEGAPWGSAAGYLEELRHLGYELHVIGRGEAPPGEGAALGGRAALGGGAAAAKLAEAPDDASLIELAEARGGQLNLLALAGVPPQGRT
jgi:FkbM family methyltransferase